MIATPTLALAFPAVIAAAAVCWRFPAAAVITAVLATAIQGSFLAFFDFDLVQLGDLVLAGLWLAFLVRLAVGGRSREAIIWPAVLACLGYVALTVALAATAEPGFGWPAFRLTAWFMLAFVVIAYADLSPATRRRIVQGIVAVTLLAAGYAVLRWIIGPRPRRSRRASAPATGST